MPGLSTLVVCVRGLAQADRSDGAKFVASLLSAHARPGFILLHKCSLFLHISFRNANIYEVYISVKTTLEQNNLHRNFPDTELTEFSTNL